MDIEVMEMTRDHVKSLKEKRKAIKELEAKIAKRKELTKRLTEFVLKVQDGMELFNKQSKSKKTNFYSPFNNQKDLSSQEILLYASKISDNIQGPRKLLEDGRTPLYF